MIRYVVDPHKAGLTPELQEAVAVKIQLDFGSTRLIDLYISGFGVEVTEVDSVGNRYRRRSLGASDLFALFGGFFRE